jgi:hypothetical protein
VRAVFDVWHDLTSGGRVGAELVGDQPPGWAPLLFQNASQQALGGLGVAPDLDNLVEHVSILINGPPQPVFLASDGDRDFVEMPDIPTVWSLTPEAASVIRPELQSSPADGLLGHDDAALEQHLPDQPQTQWKSDVQPDRMGDDLGREAVTFLADGLGHADLSTRPTILPELT